MNIRLVRRWGQHKPGQTVEVGKTMGAWLAQHGFGVEVQPEAHGPAADPTPKKRAYRRARTPQDATPASTGEGERSPAPRHSAPDTAVYPTPTQVQADENNVKPRARRKSDDREN